MEAGNIEKHSSVTVGPLRKTSTFTSPTTKNMYIFPFPLVIAKKKKCMPCRCPLCQSITPESFMFYLCMHVFHVPHLVTCDRLSRRTHLHGGQELCLVNDASPLKAVGNKHQAMDMSMGILGWCSPIFNRNMNQNMTILWFLNPKMAAESKGFLIDKLYTKQIERWRRELKDQALSK